AKTDESTRRLLWWTGIMLALTAVAFLAVGFGWLAPSPLVILLLVLAGIQVVLQLAVFMHLDVSPRLYALTYGVGLLFAVTFAVAVMILVWAY
ncbi:MAG: cytochrome C oxidase subunit IV family protein, partial [Bacillota bacterium]|nr:cytochrome C oxidase subunit IV family protein [Bacillota bacterium]